MIRCTVMLLLLQSAYVLPEDIKDDCDELLLKNLSGVENFLDSTILQEELTTINPDGLYYKTLQKGSDNKQVTENDWPSLTIDIYELDSFGKERFSFSIGPAKKINLAASIDALKKGVKGMVVGEKRRIFAHPKFTHGEIGFLAPEHYVIFDVEVVAK